MLCSCDDGPALLRSWFQTNHGRANSAIYLKIQAGKTFSYPGHSRVGHALRPIFMLWLVKISQVSSCGKFMQHLESCLLWQLKLTEFVSTCDVFNCIFPLDVQNEIQLLSRVFGYSWLVCLLVFWLRDASLVKVGNPISDGIVFVFRLARCVLKRVQNSQAILALLEIFQELHWMVSLSNYCIWCLFFYI